MKSIRLALFLLILLVTPNLVLAKYPDLTPDIVNKKITEIMKAHASYKKLTPELIKRILQNYLEELDPTKTYFIESDIKQWLDPSEEELNTILKQVEDKNYFAFEKIYDVMIQAILRRRELEKQIKFSELPAHVNPEEFKDMKWVANEQELLTRLIRIKALQIETASKFNEELKEKSLQRIEKRQAKTEDEFLSTNPTFRKNLMLTLILKAVASSLDTHTVYFTPEEASQFMISVQQRLFGIGAQLRDDLNGFTIVKMVEGGPAAENKQLKVKDRIVAVNGEPVVGMDITDAVELIRGEKNTPVTLTVIRETTEGSATKDEKLDIKLMRGEVVLKETRYEASYEPFGDGIIGYLRLFSFYQDPESSSAVDLANEIEKMKKDHHLKGIILDLRYNSGGMLSQAVAVTGLFTTKGIVVSIKDDTGAVQHLRDLDGKMTWDGPLVVLVNRASASASEIVAGTLQDYGRAIIVGDDHTYGKGSFQTFTLNSTADLDPEGEYKVTRGRYYTVSGKTPQLHGVLSDIVIPGALSETEIGEKFSKYPLEGDQIKPNFDDDLSDIPYFQRERVKQLYKFDLQTVLTQYTALLDQLKKNSAYRIENHKGYQKFLKELKKTENENVENEEADLKSDNDLQLVEAYNIIKDMILLIASQKPATAQGASK